MKRNLALISGKRAEVPASGLTAIVVAAINTSEPVLLCSEKLLVWIIGQLPKPSGW